MSRRVCLHRTRAALPSLKRPLLLSPASSVSSESPLLNLSTVSSESSLLNLSSASTVSSEAPLLNLSQWLATVLTFFSGELNNLQLMNEYDTIAIELLDT